jgi:bifunctional non-homologous end joining protein LigD
VTKPGVPPRTQRFTNTDKVLFPELGITKGDVLQYYRRVAKRLLPFLRGRPLSLERLPDGLGEGKPHFWQKDTPAHYPDWVPRIDLPSERGKPVHYALVNDEKALLYLVNQGTLTFHTWLSRIDDLDRPDFVLFDLDPGPAAFAEVIAVARLLHERLVSEGHRAYLKTSGKTGLHLLVPWTQAGGYEEARGWALDLATHVADEHPDVATVETRKAKRGGRVYVDMLQNARGHHAVPPYVVRAVSAATVSTPLHWRELTPDLSPKQFTMQTVVQRFARQKSDPMAPLLRSFKATVTKTGRR